MLQSSHLSRDMMLARTSELAREAEQAHLRREARRAVTQPHATSGTTSGTRRMVRLARLVVRLSTR